MASSVIVLNSKSRCSVRGFCESKAVMMAIATGATVFEVDLVFAFGFRCSFHFMLATTRCCIASIAFVCQNVALQMVAPNAFCL